MKFIHILKDGKMDEINYNKKKYDEIQNIVIPIISGAKYSGDDNNKPHIRKLGLETKQSYFGKITDRQLYCSFKN